VRGCRDRWSISSKGLRNEKAHLLTVVLNLIKSRLGGGDWKVANTLFFKKDSSRDLKGRPVSLCQQTIKNNSGYLSIIFLGRVNVAVINRCPVSHSYWSS